MEGENHTPAEKGKHTSVENGFSRRQVIVGGAAAGAAVGIGGAAALARSGRAQAAQTGASAATAPAGRGDGDLVLVNGKIHTMDGSNRVVSSAVIRRGRFEQVGNEVVAPAGARVIDLGGRTVVPGLVDTHIHTVLMGLRPGYHTPLENATSIADVQATLAARRPDVPDGVPQAPFITTIGGFHTNQFAERRLPTLAELDAAVADRPVFVMIGFSGPSATNSQGRLFFLSRGVPVGLDGSIGSGAPSQAALFHLRQLQTFEDQERSTLDAMAYAIQVGLTTHVDQGAFPASGTPNDAAAHADQYRMHRPFLALHGEGLLSVRLRINYLHLETDAAVPQLQARLRNAFPFFPRRDHMVKSGGIGEFTASGTGDAWMQGTRLVAQAGWRNENHSLSRTDFETIIGFWEQVNGETPIVDLRWVLAHVPFITREWVDRLKALGGGVNVTGGWRYLTGTATANGAPFRMLLESGIPLAAGGDGMQIAPMNPWLHVYYMVTGRNALGQLINDGQQLTRLEALGLYTSRTKWFMREDDLGSIEVGNHGDLVVLSSDYFTVPDEGLKRLRPVLTVVGGRAVYDAGVLTDLEPGPACLPPRFDWRGFFPPVSNPPTVNVVEAGSTVPLKFSLGGDFGLDVLAPGYPKTSQTDCATGLPEAPLTGTESKGGSGLKFAGGRYVYDWNTDEAWAGSCRELVLKLVDGSEHKALFRFKAKG